MKAVVKFRDGRDGWEVREVPRRDPADHEVELRIGAAGICGSELHLYHDNHSYTPPVVVGHEFTGQISRVGAAVTGWAVGDRVVSENHLTACGTCRFCRTGNMALCPGRVAVGYSMDGGWTDYISMHTRLMHRVPDAVGDEAAAMVEPAAVLTEALCVREPVEAGETVLVQGCGTIGLLAAMVARAAGAGRVLITGTEADERVRLPLARTLDVDRVVNVQREDLRDAVRELTGGAGADTVVECSGAASAVDSALDCVRRLGRIVAIGECAGPDIPFRWNAAIFKAVRVQFTFGSNWRAWELALQWMAAGKLPVERLITHRLPMAEFHEGFRLLDEKEAVKVILLPFGDG